MDPNTQINNIELFIELLKEGDDWFGSWLDPFHFNDVTYDGPRQNIPLQYEMFNVKTPLEASSFIHNICEQSNITDDPKLVDVSKIADSLYNKFINTSSAVNNLCNIN